MSAPQIKVSYFDMHGRADLTRLLLTFATVPFEDERLSFDQWAEVKPTTPLRKAPLMQVDGKTYVQSMAMARYAAKVAGLYPSDALEAFHAEMISETLCELFETFVDINFHTKDAAGKAEKSAALVREAAPLKLGMLEGLVQGKFFMGDEPSFVDIQLFDMVHNALYKKNPGLRQGVPQVRGHRRQHQDGPQRGRLPQEAQHGISKCKTDLLLPFKCLIRNSMQRRANANVMKKSPVTGSTDEYTQQF